MDILRGLGGPADDRQATGVLTGALRGRAARRRFLALGAIAYVLVRQRRSVIRGLEDLVDLIPWGWGAVVAALILGLVVWLLQRGRTALPERREVDRTEADLTPRTFAGSARSAHEQFARRALLVSALLTLLLWIGRGGFEPASFVATGLIFSLVCFAFLELRLWIWGGRQSVRLDRDGVTVRDARSRKAMGWDQMADVVDPLGADGITLKGRGDVPDIRIRPEGHRSREFSQMAALVERRLALGRSAAGFDVGRGSSHQVWAWAGTFALSIAAVVVVEVSVATRVMTSASMDDTLKVGDFVLATPIADGFDPDPGMILIFEAPHQEGTELVKRVVGMPGDTLEMRDKALYRNGERQAEPWVSWADPEADDRHPWMDWQETYLTRDVDREDYRPSRDQWGPLVVPDDRFFMLGDNRDLSLDSRYWGLVEREALSAKPRLIYYSYDRDASGLVTFLREARWDRIGRLVDGLATGP